MDEYCDLGAEQRFRPAREEDEPALVRLFEQAFHREITPAHWRWKHGRVGVPCPTSWVGVNEDDLPVFHYGGWPTELMIEGRLRPAMIAVDAFTDIRMRRRGLLTNGAQHAHNAWRHAGAATILGLPNEQWGSRISAVGWEPLIELGWRVRLLRPMGFIARRLGVARDRAPSQLPLPEQPSIPSESDLRELVDRSRENAAFSMVADRSWWLWRFAQSPMLRYELTVLMGASGMKALGATRVLENGSTAVVAKLEAVDDRACVELLARIATKLKARGIDSLMALAPVGSLLERALRRSGFLFPKARFRLFASASESDLPIDRMRDSSRWWLSAGDFDVA